MERKKCIHISRPARCPLMPLSSLSLWSPHASSVLPPPRRAPLTPQPPALSEHWRGLQFVKTRGLTTWIDWLVELSDWWLPLCLSGLFLLPAVVDVSSINRYSLGRICIPHIQSFFVIPSIFYFPKSSMYRWVSFSLPVSQRGAACLLSPPSRSSQVHRILLIYLLPAAFRL